MIPRECKCKYCGARILWVTTPEGRRIPIESRFTPLKKRFGDATAPALWTNEGVRIPCEPLPAERMDEADGFAHKAHICQAGARVRKKRPLTRREKFREAYELE